MHLGAVVADEKRQNKWREVWSTTSVIERYSLQRDWSVLAVSSMAKE